MYRIAICPSSFSISSSVLSTNAMFSLITKWLRVVYSAIHPEQIYLFDVKGQSEICKSNRLRILFLLKASSKTWQWIFHEPENSDHTLTHWGRVAHICVGNLIIIGPDNGLSHGRRQAIIWTNAGIFLIGHRGTNLWKINWYLYSFIQENSFENVVCEMASMLYRPQCVKNVHIRTDKRTLTTP